MLETPEGPVFESNAIARYGKKKLLFLLFCLSVSGLLASWHLGLIDVLISLCSKQIERGELLERFLFDRIRKLLFSSIPLFSNLLAPFCLLIYWFVFSMFICMFSLCRHMLSNGATSPHWRFMETF